MRQRRRYERRIDLDASLTETVTVVQAWAAREHIALRGDEPDAPTLRLWGDAPAGQPERRTGKGLPLPSHLAQRKVAAHTGAAPAP